jgi:hypothetical protein
MDQLANPTKPQPGPVFLFRGNAVAAGGYLTKLKGAAVEIDKKRVTVHGESSLPIIGGISHSLVEHPDLPFPKFIEYGACSTVAEGIGYTRSTETSLYASVQKVRVTNSPSKSDNVPNLLSVAFLADRLAVSARSSHPSDGAAQFQLLGEPDTSGMSLVLTPQKGVPVTIPLSLKYDPAFLSPCSMDDLDTRFLRDRKFFDDQAAGLQSSEPLVFGKSKLPRAPHGYVVTSVVTAIRRGDQEIRGNVLVEPGLGTISFGTVIMNGDSRRVTLVRIKLGSEEEGFASFAGTDSNGIWN